MRYVVTGGAGFIGSAIAKLLVKNNHEVVIVDNLHTGDLFRLKEIKDSVIFHQIDIRKKTELEDIIKNSDGVFHEAGLTSVVESFKKPKEYYDVNVNGTKNIFEICQNFEKKVVFASSSSVYGDVEEIPISENFDRNPINLYAETKVKNENMVTSFFKDNSQIIGLRYFNVYGKGQTGTYAGVITQFLKRLGKKLPPIIHGTGSQIRDFIFVNDVAEANILIMNSNTNSGFFNIGSGKPTSILDLANMMIKISSLNLQPEFDNNLPGDIENSLADISLTEKTFGWKSNSNLYDQLKNLMSL